MDLQGYTGIGILNYQLPKGDIYGWQRYLLLELLSGADFFEGDLGFDLPMDTVIGVVLWLVQSRLSSK